MPIGKPWYASLSTVVYESEMDVESLYSRKSALIVIDLFPKLKRSWLANCSHSVAEQSESLSIVTRCHVVLDLAFHSVADLPTIATLRLLSVFKQFPVCWSEDRWSEHCLTSVLLDHQSVRHVSQ